LLQIGHLKIPNRGLTVFLKVEDYVDKESGRALLLPEVAVPTAFIARHRKIMMILQWHNNFCLKMLTNMPILLITFME
jgi:hypothetical protein